MINNTSRNILFPFGVLMAAVASSFVISSCTLMTSAIPMDKLPEPIRSEMVKIKRDQDQMLKVYSSGSVMMFEAYSSILEGCGFEKESQKLKVHAAAIKQASSSEEANKSIRLGFAVINEAQGKISASKGMVVKSKESFQRGFQQKKQAYALLQDVSLKAAVNAAVAAKTFKKATPIQKAACISQIDPLITVAKDVPVFFENERKFNDQCQQIGKQYSMPLPKLAVPTAKPISLKDF